MDKSFVIPISRRDFMKLMGLTAAGTFLSVQDNAPRAEASAAAAHMVDFENADLPTLFNIDVCVVGGGSAGTAAAVTAARRAQRWFLWSRAFPWAGWRHKAAFIHVCQPILMTVIPHTSRT